MSLDPQLEKQLREGFRYLNKFMLTMWRLGLGGMLNSWPDVGGRIMVITHTGWKTGLRRRTPVNYAIVDDELYCIAGFGKVSHWFKNIQANPRVEVWLPNGWWTGTAVDISDAENKVDLVRQVIIGSGVVGQMFGLNPKTMSDAELAEVTASYRLIHIERIAPQTGADGPGELAWIWPWATMILLPLALIRRRRR